MATPHVASDTFICGTCQAYFNDLVTFLEHKRSTSCGVTVPYNSEVQSENVTVLAEAPTVENTSSTSPAGNTKSGLFLLLLGSVCVCVPVSLEISHILP